MAGRFRLVRDIRDWIARLARSLYFPMLDNVHLHPSEVLIHGTRQEAVGRLYEEGVPHAGRTVEVDLRLDIAVARHVLVPGGYYFIRIGRARSPRGSSPCLYHARVM